MQRARTQSKLHAAVIGIVGERNERHPLHVASEQALTDGPDLPAIEWLATDRIAAWPAAQLWRYSGFLIAPGSPYRNMQGALTAIRFARENRLPLLGTCGGFQHLIVEFARNVGGVPDAEHAETDPGAAHLAVTALHCSLAGQIRPVRLVAGSRAAAIYGATEVLEPFYCNYGLNPDYRPLLESLGLSVSGVGQDAEARIVELSAHPFFVGTLYVPQARHKPGATHPLLSAFVAAARLAQPHASMQAAAASD
jgi:CTP synthase (UTP-ammonia lyase)